MKKYIFALALIAGLMILLAACGGQAPAPTQAPAAPAQATQAPAAQAVKPGDLKFITVVKSMGFNWFKQMEVGVKKFATDTGVQAVQQGPSKADEALENQVIEDAIAQKANAILVVPHQIDAAEPVLKKAMDAGIIVVTGEDVSVKNAKYDVEAFDNPSFGRHVMDNLADCMKGEGKYVQFVGSLTSETHNIWADSASAYQKEKFPKMQMVGSKNESKDDIPTAYQITKDLLKTYPDLKGIEGSAAGDIVGAGQAVQEAGLTGKVCLAGTSIPSYAGDLLKAGVIGKASAWDPATQGYAMNKVALMLLQGQTITDGMNLGVPGYEKIRLDGKVIYGNAWIDFTKDNMADYPF